MCMFRDLARMTASLKGLRYEGALIARAVWEGSVKILSQIYFIRQ